MKKAIILLALLVSGVSISQDIHAITYLDVPRSAAADFIRLHKKFVDFSQGEKRTIKSDWLFAHTFGSNFTFMIVDVYETVADQVADNGLAVMSENIKNMNLSEEEQVLMSKEFQKYFNLYLEGHSDEVRQIIDSENMFYVSEAFDASKKQLLVVNKFNPKWSDRSEFLELWKESSAPMIERGNIVAVFPTGHYSGTSDNVYVNIWYPSWDAFVAEEKAVAAGPLSEMTASEKKMWDMAGDHSDEIMTLVGTNWGNETFVLSQ